jgi:hypothetical protein
MELVAAVDYVRDEVDSAIGDEYRSVHPAAVKRLQAAAEHLAAARAVLSDATRYGVVCEVARLADLGTDTECDPALENTVEVELDGPGYTELACPPHAAEAVRLHGAHIAAIRTDAARPLLVELLGEHRLPFDDHDHPYRHPDMED